MGPKGEPGRIGDKGASGLPGTPAVCSYVPVSQLFCLKKENKLYFYFFIKTFNLTKKRLLLHQERKEIKVILD